MTFATEDIVDLDMLRCSLCYKYPNKRKCFSCAVADEIERLRVEVAAWRDLDKERIRTIRQGNDFMLSQDAEIEQLRAALALAIGELSTYGPMRYTSPDQLMEHFMREARRG